MTINTVWADRETGKKYQVEAVSSDGRVQISPLDGGDYRIMAEKSLRSNYQLVAMTPEKAEAVTEPEPQPEPELLHAIEKEGATEEGKAEDMAIMRADAEKAGRAPAGRVQMPDGKVIAGSQFITEVCGKSRDETYKVDSPIRWLANKPAGQELLKSQGATIVYGQALTK